MSLARGIIIVGALAALYYYFVILRRPKDLYDFRTVSPEHYDRIADALARFDEERTRRGDIHALSAHRATVSKHLNELKFRMPNDARALEALEGIIRTKEREMEDAIQRVRTDEGKTLEFPYAVGTYFMHLEPILLKQDQGQSPAYSMISSLV